MNFPVRAFWIALFMFPSGQLLSAEWFSFGVDGGLRLTDDVGGTLTPESKRYIVGPKVEVGLPKGFSLEVDALYRRVGFSGAAFAPNVSAFTRERNNSWEIPMILKYRLPVPVVHPFAGIGYAPRIVSGGDVSSGSYLSRGFVDNNLTVTTVYFFNQRSSTNYALTNGIVVSGGFDLDVGHVRFSPEVRYIHWASQLANEPVGLVPPIQFISPQNEAFVLLGISFK